MIDKLIEELEAAEVGSAELDFKMGVALKRIKPGYALGSRDFYGSPIKGKLGGIHIGGIVDRFTRSLDATEDALPKGWGWRSFDTICDVDEVYERDARWVVYINTENKAVKFFKEVMAEHRSLIIARAIAVLKAHKEQEH